MRDQELRDSSDLTTRSAMVDRLGEDGYLFFRGLLDPEPLHALWLEIMGTLQEFGWLEPDVPAPEARVLPPVRVPMSPEYYPAYVAVQKLEEFHRLGHHPRLASLFRTIIGDDAFCLPPKLVRLWFPEVPSDPHLPSAPHQDYPTYHIPDQFTAWIPLMHVPREMGGLRVLRGSQDRGAFDPARWEPVIHDDDPDWRTTDYRLGDVLVMHCLTVHHALPNLTQRLRVSVDVRWSAARDGVPDYALLPDLDPQMIPGWEALTAGWSDTRWVEIPAGVPIIEGKEPFVDIRQPASRFVNVPPEPRWDLAPLAVEQA